MKNIITLGIISTLLLSGCWDKRELNEISITMGIGIDELDDQYVVTAQVVVPSEVSVKGSTGGSPVTLFKAEGETILEATSKLSRITPRTIYPGHLRVLVISDTVAEKGIGSILDFFERNWEIRSDFQIVIAKDMTAEDILNVTTAIENIPANKIYNTLHVSDKNWSATNVMTLEQLIRDIKSLGSDAVISGIQITGDKELGISTQNIQSITPKARIQLNGLGVLKKDKLVGWLTESESKGYKLITNQIQRTMTTLSCPDGGTVSIDVIREKADIHAKVKNGQPKIDVSIRSEANIGEVDCQIDLTNKETISKLEKIYEEKIKEVTQSTIQTLQEDYKADVLGFGDAVHRVDPKIWKELKEDWAQHFSTLQVNVKVESKIRRVGIIVNSYEKNEED